MTSRQKVQALNLVPKAIADLRSHPCPDAPITRAAYRWIADLLEQSQVFILPDCGELLDRSKPKPEVPGTFFRPPFPITACEYLAQRPQRHDDVYTAMPCSKRIALAWDWTGDLPEPLCWVPEYRTLQPGVAVVGIFYIDSIQQWTCNAAAMHFAYDDQWLDRASQPTAPFVQAMIDRGDMPPAMLKMKGYASSFVPLAIEVLTAAQNTLGSQDAVIDAVRADNNDECNAYFDLCYALACKNVTPETQTASAVLNKERRRKGRPALKDFHFLSLGDAGNGTGHMLGDRSGPRSHLRRGHIRRLAPDRVTWVNQTMVHGHGGFVDKTYRMKGAA